MISRKTERKKTVKFHVYELINAARSMHVLFFSLISMKIEKIKGVDFVLFYLE